MKAPLRIAVTGAAGQICYSLLPRLAAGEMFGKDQPVILQLLEIPVDKAQAALRGVAMELDDCAFPLLHGLVLTDNPSVAFQDANWCLLVGSKPRGPGMERADLLKDNGKIFTGQGDAIDRVAAADCHIVVVGNPCNTNAMIAASRLRRIPKTHVTAMTRLDQNRAVTQLARKAGAAVADVTDLIIYGNHSPTMYPDFFNAKIRGRPVVEAIADRAWLERDFIPAVGKRGAAIIEARGLSSAASAANALIDHVRALTTTGAELHSVAVMSDGAYGFVEGVWASVPVRTTGYGRYEIDRSKPMNDFSRGRLKATNDELTGERDTVSDLL